MKGTLRSRYAGAAVVAALVSLPLVPAAVAQERDATTAESNRVVSKLRGLGYRSITDVDVVGNRFVVDARSPNGRDVDIILDKKTLAILRVNQS